eukprot:368987-Amphidinium_carterae.1
MAPTLVIKLVALCSITAAPFRLLSPCFKLHGSYIAWLQVDAFIQLFISGHVVTISHVVWEALVNMMAIARDYKLGDASFQKCTGDTSTRLLAQSKLVFNPMNVQLQGKDHLCLSVYMRNVGIVERAGFISMYLGFPDLKSRLACPSIVYDRLVALDVT